jgi:hypothetical protein
LARAKDSAVIEASHLCQDQTGLKYDRADS